MNQRKFVFAILLSVLLLFALSVVAQEQAPPSGQEQQQPRRPMMQTPQERLDNLAKELNLTDDQKAKIKPILEDEHKQMQALRSDTSMSPEDRRAKMMQVRDKMNDSIKAVLDKDQQKKYDEMMTKMRGPRGGPRPPQ